ncbi:hypothetical protein [Paraburkholderia sp. BCC1886]|uniref:hypothetical protein n=1 Tax=Paraburkholderia sp. BCC1886 TaxID=2562670 RepID=UPI001182E275|nr:hypothetical protein [Paraburkholderia sp. BCC1886]
MHYINVSRESRQGAIHTLYFATHCSAHFEWQRGSKTVVVRVRPYSESQELDRFTVEARNTKPDVLDVKRHILAYINQP